MMLVILVIKQQIKHELKLKDLINDNIININLNVKT